jgi:pyruvate kinase
MNDSTSVRRETERATRLERAARGIDALIRAAAAAERELAPALAAVAPSMRESARNLAHYLGVRRLDVRELQDELGRLGLSSLGRMEAHVMASLQAVAEALAALRQAPMPARVVPPAIDFDAGNALLAAHANAILGGQASAGMRTRIMVTMPTEAARDPGLIADLLDAGMDIMRINCAHDHPEAWKRMLAHLRRATRESGKRCAVSFDLAGPKVRTGTMEPGPAVVKWRPVRSATGHVVQLARVRFVARGDEAGGGDAIPVDGDFLARARRGDGIELVDARGRTRLLRVAHVAGARECVCETDSTAYVVPGTRLVLRRARRIVGQGVVGALPPVDQFISLRRGDRLDLVRGEAPGRDAVHDDDGKVLQPAFVSCAVPEVFRSVRAGEAIFFDDGRIRGVVREAGKDRIRIEVTAVARGTAKLRGVKGINLPETDLELPALTSKDVEDLGFVARNADMVALSFVQRAEDVEALLAALEELRARPIGIVLKIETCAGFDRLPALLFAAMRRPPVAVMVARGDLGVEVGFERLAEVQEEILWLCEAAHVPVIWATQVLESLAKGGMPSRAEVTDAAMGGRTECVMLNKGPFIRETLRFLTDVLARMEEHQHKKTSRLRRLRVSERAASRAPR